MAKTKELTPVQQIGRAMKKKAFEMEISTRDLATKANVSEMTIYKLFNDRLPNPTVETIFAIAGVLKMGVTLKVE